MPVSREAANDLFHALLRVHKLLLAARTAGPRIHPDVDSAAYPVLFLIARAGSARVSDIATELHNDVSTVSRQVSALVSHGLAAKEPDPTDGRAQVVTLTDTGCEALRVIQASRSTWFQGLLEDWDADEAATFTHHLQELGNGLDASLRARGATLPTLPTLPLHPTKED